jgi:para-aminobenzoate synthetase component 2
LTEGGYTMIANWLEITGLSGAAEAARGLSPRINQG